VTATLPTYPTPRPRGYAAHKRRVCFCRQLQPREKVVIYSREPIQVTDAEESHESDIHTRTGRYLLSMSIRIVCFFLAFICTGPLRWVFAVGAIVLPWVAVLIANATSRISSSDRAPAPEYSALPQQPEPRRTSAAQDDDVVIGEVIDQPQLPPGDREGPRR